MKHTLNRFESFVPREVQGRADRKQQIRDEKSKEMSEIVNSINAKISELNSVNPVDEFEKTFVDLFKDTSVTLGNKYARVIRFKKPKDWKKRYYYKGVDYGPAEWAAMYDNRDNTIDIPLSLLEDSNLNDVEKLETMFKKHFDLNVDVRTSTFIEYRDS